QALTVGPVGATFGINTHGNNLTLMTDGDFFVMNNGMTPTISTDDAGGAGKPIMIQTGMGATTTSVQIDVIGEIESTNSDVTILGGQGKRLIGGNMVPVANTFLSRPGQKETLTHIIGNMDNLTAHSGDTLALHL